MATSLGFLIFLGVGYVEHEASNSDWHAIQGIHADEITEPGLSNDLSH